MSLVLALIAVMLVNCASEPKTAEETLPPETWDISALDTGREAGFLTDYQKRLVLEVNKMRSDPQKYARYHRKDLPSTIYTYLLTMKPLPLLIIEPGLCASSLVMINARLFDNNVIIGNKGGQMQKALNDFGKWQEARYSSCYIYIDVSFDRYLYQVLGDYKYSDNKPPVLLDPLYGHFGIAEGFRKEDGRIWNLTAVLVVQEYTPILQEHKYTPK